MLRRTGWKPHRQPAQYSYLVRKCSASSECWDVRTQISMPASDHALNLPLFLLQYRF